VLFQADADLNLTILLAVLRREPAIDFQTAEMLGLQGRSDSEVLALAADRQRLLVTHDHKRMPSHFAEFVTRRSSSGVLLVPQHLAVSVVVEDLLLIWGASEAEEWINRICYLPI